MFVFIPSPLELTVCVQINLNLCFKKVSNSTYTKFHNCILCNLTLSKLRFLFITDFNFDSIKSVSIFKVLLIDFSVLVVI